MSRIKRILLLQPESVGGNFEYVAIPRQGMLFLSAALKQWKAPSSTTPRSGSRTVVGESTPTRTWMAWTYSW